MRPTAPGGTTKHYTRSTPHLISYGYPQARSVTLGGSDAPAV